MGSDQAGMNAYDLFISYSHDDIALVERLVARLKHDGFRVWFDRKDMSPTHSVGGNLADALDRCRQTLICLSDSYCTKDYTLWELQLNFLKDPANRDRRTIPAIVRGPLTVAVPAEVRPIPSVDLTNPATYDSEYERIKSAIARTPPPERKCPSPEEVDALRQLDPDKALVLMIRYARDLYGFIFSQEKIGEAVPQSWKDLAATLLEQPSTLPVEVRMHIHAILQYADLIQHGASTAAIQPGLHALRALSVWASGHYNVASAPEDPFVAFWRQFDQEWPSKDVPYQLMDGRRRLTPVGAVHPGRKFDDRSGADLLIVPVEPERWPTLVSDVEHCRLASDKPPSPLTVLFFRQFDWPNLGTWALLALGGADGCRLEQMRTHVGSFPPSLAMALGRQLLRAFQMQRNRSEGLTCALFVPDNVVLDRSGLVKIVWNWTPQDSGHAVDHDAHAADRGEFWFSRAGQKTMDEARRRGWVLVHRCATDLLSGCPEATTPAWRSAATVEDALQVLDALPRPEADDQDIVRTAVECTLENKLLPPWMSTLSADEPTPEHPPPRPHSQPAAAFRLLSTIRVRGAHGAWPLGDSHVVVWQNDQILSVRSAADGAEVWRDAMPADVRLARVAADGEFTLASWQGDLRCFRDDGLRGHHSMGWTIGDVRPFGGRWLAGTWDGRLLLVGGERPACELQPSVTDGVWRIAVSSDDNRFAVLSLRRSVSVFEGGRRTGQTASIDDACDIAFANGEVVVLAGEKLVRVGRLGDLERPDRVPSRGALRLLTCPPDERCLVGNERGQSWIVDRAGTYPRGPWLPPGDRSLTTAAAFRRMTVRADPGWAYWRNGTKIVAWHEASSATLSRDGRRIVVVLPDAVELYQDAG
jgi:hypothetical protein